LYSLFRLYYKIKNLSRSENVTALTKKTQCGIVISEKNLKSTQSCGDVVQFSFGVMYNIDIKYKGGCEK